MRPDSRIAVASTGGRYGSRKGSRAQGGNIDTDVAASTPYGARASNGSGGVINRKRAASRAASVRGGSGTPSAAATRAVSAT